MVPFTKQMIILKVALGIVLGLFLFYTLPLWAGLFLSLLPLFILSSPIILFWWLFPILWPLWLSLEILLLLWVFKR